MFAVLGSKRRNRTVTDSSRLTLIRHFQTKKESMTPDKHYCAVVIRPSTTNVSSECVAVVCSIITNK